MNRIERISAILIQLQSKKIVKAQEIAKRFDISLRTVYRDMKALEATGVPILAEAGYGYSLVEGYKLPPVQFTLSEATAFLTAEKLIEQLTDKSMTAGYQSAMYKIKALSKNSDKQYLETLDENIAVLSNPYMPSGIDKPDVLKTSIQAISNKHVLRLHYFANHNQVLSERSVEPVGVFFQFGKWYLIAYCHLRKDYRNFRADRIKSISELEQQFEKVHPTLKKYLKQISKDEQLHTVVLRVENEALKYLGEQKYYNGFVSQKSGTTHTEMKFLCASLEGIMRWYVMIADHADIISPKELKELAGNYMKQVAKRLK